MKNWFKITFLLVFLSLSSCSILKKDCKCPNFYRAPAPAGIPLQP